MNHGPSRRAQAFDSRLDFPAADVCRTSSNVWCFMFYSKRERVRLVMVLISRVFRHHLKLFSRFPIPARDRLQLRSGRNLPPGRLISQGTASSILKETDLGVRVRGSSQSLFRDTGKEQPRLRVGPQPTSLSLLALWLGLPTQQPHPNTRYFRSTASPALVSTIPFQLHIGASIRMLCKSGVFPLARPRLYNGVETTHCFSRMHIQP